MWLLVGGKDPPTTTVFHFKKTRKHENVTDLIGDYRGNLHSDKYGAYEQLATKKVFNWCPCWAHIRRKFVEAESGNVEFRNWMIQRIGTLFFLEKECWKLSPEERQLVRENQVSELIEEIIQAVKRELEEGRALPKSKYKEALHYFYGLIPYLKNYTKDSFARIDNNTAERAIRPLAIGRKNWLFVGSEKGGESAATLLSLIQTCRNLNINPRAYFEDLYFYLNVPRGR